MTFARDEANRLAHGAPGTERRPQRSVYLDLLRAIALCRVVVYHAVSFEWVTLFTAMPLMFFIAGSLYAASLERRAARQVIIDRYRRILLPYWGYIACMIALWAYLGVLGELGATNWVGLVFPILSPNVDSIEVKRRGVVRRAKLYYLRDRRGKSARIAERQTARKVAVPAAGTAEKAGDEA